MPKKLIFSQFCCRLNMDMCLQKGAKIIIFLVFLAFLTSCEAIDTILNSSNAYKVNINVNDTPLDELAFVASGDSIRPFFAEPVSSDQDVTALLVFIRNPAGEITASFC